jgi:hypothetical protein
VARTWSAGSVSWNQPWSNPGGDVIDRLYVRREVDFDLGAQSVAIDVTRLIKEVLEGNTFSDGFLLTVPPAVGAGFSTADASRFGELAGARLDITYRKIGLPRAPD